MSELRQVLDDGVQKHAEKHVGLAAAVVRANETVMTGRGVTSEHGAPPGPHTLFQIGSVTKVFTSLLLADLVVAGHVRLDQPVTEFLPDVEVPMLGRPITLRDLATHTSGLPRLPKHLVRNALRHRDNPYSQVTGEDLERALEQYHPRRPPGSRVRYSNFGAAVLGDALSRRMGRSYDELVADRICRRLDMPDTVVRSSLDQSGRHAQGHSRRGRPVPDWEMPAMPGMGALRSTTTDMITFLRAQLGPDSTPLADAVRMTQEPRAQLGRTTSVCLGWFRSPGDTSSGPMLWHNGGTGGTFSFVGFVPSDGTGVVVLANNARSVDGVGVDLLRRVSAL